MCMEWSNVKIKLCDASTCDYTSRITETRFESLQVECGWFYTCLWLIGLGGTTIDGYCNWAYKVVTNFGQGEVVLSVLRLLPRPHRANWISKVWISKITTQSKLWISQQVD